ncbi:hypothetical protein FMM05_08655 [Flavobacterium zepuense]|uniref:Uncharacterized protein n=1 Tax=Flavobacterium zepuense TaxID=2593302 RepID=A0A552V4F9_9FLAO|nr:hypothetical protein [Flavobacterium zepuense]TRW25364.1 hypothetical protein FMM05_08655 [Flavobacterium zepuense]
MSEKFKFPNAGIHIVAHKVGEADYFLEQLKKCHSWDQEFDYNFSAFVSAMRSITFSLQFVMSKYPGFDEWYKIRQEKLRSSKLAKAFVEFRNHAQKTGIIPIAKERSFNEGIFYETTQFYVPKYSETKGVPDGTVKELSERCLIEILTVVAECYKDFDVYIDPRVLFTERALEKLNWTIEDIEEMCGFPRGYTNMNFKDDTFSNEEIRLNLLRNHGGDETLQIYLDKYIK